jgi:excisionase family DNA binding protein
MAADQRPLNEVVFLTVAEVASVMRVSKMTVYRLVHSGHLPAIRVGRSFRVPEQAVQEYLRESFVGVETAWGGAALPSDYVPHSAAGRLGRRRSCGPRRPAPSEKKWARVVVGSVIKKRRKRMAKKKHRKLLKRTRVQRRNKK